MAENLVYEPFSESVQQYDETFFSKIPTDLRFKKVTFQNYYPTNPVRGARTISFNLPPWPSQTFYLLHQALMSIKLKIITPTDTKLPDDAMCAPINNVLGSIFQVIINFFIFKK
jgi:hypothetical protein